MWSIALLISLTPLASSQTEPALSLRQKFESAVVAFQADRLEQARSLLDECLAVAPADYQLHQFKGVVVSRLEDWDAAEASFREVLRIKPEFTPALFNLALVHKRKGRYQSGIDAIEAYLKTRKVAANEEAEFDELAASLYELKGEPVRAAELLYHALTLDPGHESYYYSLGSLLLSHVNYAEAQKVFQEGVSRFPSASRLFTGLGTAAALRTPPANDYALAARSFLRAAVLAPDDPLPYRFLSFLPAFAYATGEVAADMASTLEELARAHPDNPTAQYLFAAALFQRHRAERGSVDAERVQSLLARALKLDPKLSKVHFWLGKLYLHLGRSEEAVSVFQKALSLDPEVPVYHYQLGQAYMLAGRPEEGRKQLERFNKLYSEEAEEAVNRRRLIQVLTVKR